MASEMSPAQAPDLSNAFPRSGRDLLGGYAWLARLADKVRAEHAGTQGDYVGYCPMSMSYLNAVGVSREDFDQLVQHGASDQELVNYFDEHVSAEKKTASNDMILRAGASHLDQQDSEEGRV